MRVTSAMLSPALVGFVESGNSVLVGTRDVRLVPECVRAFGVRAERGGRDVTVFVPVATGARTMSNIADNGRVAICVARPRDHRSIQLKGKATAVRDATARDRKFVEAYRSAFCDELAWIGLPLRLSRRFAHWPCHAIRLRVESVFDQTPGPGAGEPLEESAGSRA